MKVFGTKNTFIIKKYNIMKKIKYLFLITISILVFNSCADDHEDVTTNLNFVTFANNSLKLVVNKNESNNIDVTLFTTKVSGSDRTISIYTDLDLTSADPSSYTIPTSVTIPANTNAGIFNINVEDINISESGERIVVNFDTQDGLYMGDALTLDVALYCPLNINDFLGDYIITEAGYGDYGTTITLDPDVPNRIWVTNFWDWTNDLAYYDLKDDGTVTMPSQQILMGDGNLYECNGTGTYNACNGTFHMEYGGDVAGTVHDFTPAL